MKKLLLRLLFMSTISMSLCAASLGKAKVRFFMQQGAHFKLLTIDLAEIDDMPSLVRHLCIKKVLHDESVPTFLLEDPVKILISHDDWMSLNAVDVVIIQKKALPEAGGGGGGGAADRPDDHGGDELETKEEKPEQD